MIQIHHQHSNEDEPLNHLASLLLVNYVRKCGDKYLTQFVLFIRYYFMPTCNTWLLRMGKIIFGLTQVNPPITCYRCQSVRHMANWFCGTIQVCHFCSFANVCPRIENSVSTDFEDEYMEEQPSGAEIRNNSKAPDKVESNHPHLFLSKQVLASDFERRMLLLTITLILE